MYQRQICPSMGALRRPLTREALSLTNGSRRSFHVSASRQEDAPEKPTSSSDSPSTPRVTRRERSATAFRQLQNLPGAASSTEQAGTALTRSKPQSFQRKPQLPGQPSIGARAPPPGTLVRAPPPGKLVRAPTNLRLTRAPTGAPRKDGVNLQGRGDRGGRAGGSSGARKPVNSRSGENRPKPRDRRTLRELEDKKESKNIEDHLTNGMVRQLCRLQKLEWDRQLYEPIYGKQEALDDLVQLGSTLFKGESPKPKEKTKLDKKFEEVLGIQNMFVGAQYQPR